MVSWSFKAPSHGGSGWKPTVVMERVVEHFELFPEPQSDMELVDAVWGNPEYIVIAITTLVSDGKLVRDEENRVSLKDAGVPIERDALWEEEL